MPQTRYRYRINPYESPPPRTETRRFQFGLIPATIFGFIGVVAMLFGLMVVPNVIRDGQNGYGSRYLILASLMPAMLFVFAAVCAVASFEFAAGRWRMAIKTTALLLPIFLAFLMYVRALG